MPRIKRYKLAYRLATVALGGATLAIATGQLPAQAAYGPPPPPPPPGGYQNVVTSQTCGSGGCVIVAHIDGLLVSVTVPAGDFSRSAQITLLAPNVQGIGQGARSGYRAIGGIGILVQVNGKTYTGTLAKPFTVELSGPEIRPGDRVAVWNGTTFTFIASTETGDTEEFSYGSGAEQDFAVLAPTRGIGRADQPAQDQATRSSRRGQVSDLVLESLFLAPAGQYRAGIGVLSPEWLAARSH